MTLKALNEIQEKVQENAMLKPSCLLNMGRSRMHADLTSLGISFAIVKQHKGIKRSPITCRGTILRTRSINWDELFSVEFTCKANFFLIFLHGPS